MDKLYKKVLALVAGPFFDRVPLVDDLGYDIEKIRKDGLILAVEGGRRFNITVVEIGPRVG